VKNENRKEAENMVPFDLGSIGKLLLLLAGGIAAIGLVLILIGNVPFLGRLPGDIVIRSGRGSFFFPIVTCIVLSIVLTILVNLILWLLRR
jgi:hypothetical protein